MNAETATDVAAIDEALASALPPGSLYAVGGRVRDEVRAGLDGIPRVPKDLDYIVTGVPLEALLAKLRLVGKADAVGASFAVVKCTLLGRTVDVALPRRERSTGTHHRDFTVEFGPEIPLAEDLARRDFRMNMMARAIANGTIVDPYGGAADVAARRIDVLRLEAFEEDPLRILRAAQFAARFGFAPTERTLAAMRRAAPLVTTVSAERTRDELIKLLEAAPKPSDGLEILRETGVLDVILPELVEGVGVEQNVYHAYDVYRHNLATADAAPVGDLIGRLAALLHDVGKPRVKDGPHFYRHEDIGADMTRALLERLHFKGETVDVVTNLVAHHMYVTDPAMTDAAIRRSIRRIGPEALERQFALRAADIAGSGMPERDESNERFEARVWAELRKTPPLRIVDLAVDGRDAIAALDDAAREAGVASSGRRGSPAVGALLRELLDAVVEDPSMNERTTLVRELHIRAVGMLHNVSRET